MNPAAIGAAVCACCTCTGVILGMALPELVFMTNNLDGNANWSISMGLTYVAATYYKSDGTKVTNYDSFDCDALQNDKAPKLDALAKFDDFQIKGSTRYFSPFTNTGVTLGIMTVRQPHWNTMEEVCNASIGLYGFSLLLSFIAFIATCIGICVAPMMMCAAATNFVAGLFLMITGAYFQSQLSALNNYRAGSEDNIAAGTDKSPYVSWSWTYVITWLGWLMHWMCAGACAKAGMDKTDDCCDDDHKDGEATVTANI